jgi:type IV pilus assembly protein PilY1
MKFRIKKKQAILLFLITTGILIPVIYLFSAPTNKSACCSIGTSYGDSVVNPAKGGDKDMFTIPALPPNIIWLLDTSASMQDISCGGNCDSVYPNASGFYRCNLGTSPNYGKVYPSQNNCGANCGGNGNCVKTSPCGIDGNNYLDAFTKFGYSWPQSTPNPFDSENRPYNSFENQRDSQVPADGLFEAYRVYYGPSDGTCGFTWTDAGFDVTICGGTVSTSQYECNTTGALSNIKNTCLNNCSGGSCFLKPTGNASTSCTSNTCRNCVKQIREKGYWYSGTRYYFSGNLLNYYPPKYVVARKVLKDVIIGTKKIRMGLFRFDGVRPPNSCNNCSDSGCGACIISDLNPPCPLCLNEGAAYDNNRTSLINAINNMTVSVFNTNTPTAEALFNIGQYYSGAYSTVFGASSVKSGLNPKSGANDSIAYSCMQNYAVIITDGLPTQDGNDYNLQNAVGNSDGDGNPCDRAGSFNPAQCPPYGNNGYGHLLDDVAYSLYTKDLRPSMNGTQRIVTYTIGFGTEMFGGDDLLRRAANNSTGLYFSASDPSGLADALKKVLDDVIRRATSYSNISAASFQVSSTSGAYIPRFFPSTASFWEGYLYAFRQYNEVLTGVNLNNDTDPDTGQPDATDQLIVDRDTDIVTVDNNTGYPVKQNGQPANEYWEAGRCLSDPTYHGGTCFTAHNDRKIYTAIDLNNDGVISSTEQIPFRVDIPSSQFAVLRDFLGLEGNSYCSDLSTQLGFTFPDATKVSTCAGFTNALDYCACLLIQYVRGMDILDEDGDNNRDDDRPWKLGDIFHSTPQEVIPPDKKFCAFNQCLRTLFDEKKNPSKTGTVLKTYSGTGTAFDKFIEYYGKRDRIILVGANDGMLHAFHAGDVIMGDNPESIYDVEEFYYDQGTGKELWAFIPPDLLPKLKNLTYLSNRHNYFVDSTPWVRNIWYDNNHNYIKECEGTGGVDACEFRTIVVSGERGGGTHFFALDITNVDTPQFLWLFPQPCSEDALKMGLTYAEALPQQPPIGPIRYIDPGNPNNNEYRERYVVFLNAGYDPRDIKGRGVFMLDAWTGEKIYEATYDSADAIKSNMKFSVTAPVYADDWVEDPTRIGFSSDADYDYLWDIASFGDLGGQIWTLRFIDPDPSKWYIARTFEQAQHLPFFYIAQTVASSYLRIAVGTGDRENINACSGKDCKYNDFRSCALEGCSNITANAVQEIDGKRLTVSKSWNAALLPATDSFSITSTGNTACSYINYTLNPLEINGCPVSAGSPGSNDATPEENAGIVCTSPFNCTETGDYDALVIENNRSKPGYKFYAINISKEFINDPSKAALIDASRLRDSDLLVPPNIAISGSSNGWMLSYGAVNIQTASGATLVGGETGDCVLWSAYEPNCSSGGTSDPCYTPGAGTAYLFQASLSSGKANCIKSFNGARQITIGTTVPPPPTLSYVLTGNKVYLYFIGGEWWNPLGSMGKESLLPGYIYWQEIPKPLHDCKHDKNCY